MPNNTSAGRGQRPTVLLVANWDSNVGYAWWLMESFWCRLAEQYRCRLAYPSISTLPAAIEQGRFAAIDHADFAARDRASVLRQCAYIRRNRIDAIYFTDQPLRHWSYALFRLCGVKKIVVHDHTPGVRTTPRGPKRWLKWLAQRLPLIPADAVFAVSDYIRQRAIDVACVPDSRCHTVQNGIPPYAAQPCDPYALFGIEHGKKLIVAVGRVSKYKGIHTALETLARIDDPDWHYLVLGSGPDLAECEALAQRLGIAARTTFAGARADVKDILPHCHFGLHLSQGEAFSLAIVEMMQAGLPVVVSDNPSVCGAITDGIDGAICPAAAVAPTLQRLLADPAAVRDMGQAAQRTVERSYTLANTHAQLLREFAAVVE